MPAIPGDAEGTDVTIAPGTDRTAISLSAVPPLPFSESLPEPSTFREKVLATISSSSYRKYLLTGWGISILVHLILWPVGSLLLLLLATSLPYFGDTEIDPIRAALADKDQQDEEIDTQFEANAVLLDAPPPVGEVISHQELMQTMELLNVAAVKTALDSGEPDSDNSIGLAFRIPKNGFAVTKGSFTAWTEPAHPEPGKAYLIIIQVRLPESVKVYRASDLSGTVQGTDSYQRTIPYDADAPYSAFTIVDERVVTITGRDELPIINNQVQLAIKIPGARRMVSDTIQIRSRTLRERQTLEITFGQPLADQ